MNFAERYGHINVRKTLQLDSIDNKLKIKIWNLIDSHIIKQISSIYDNQSRIECDRICQHIWTEYLDRDVDEMYPYKSNFGLTFFQDLKTIYLNMKWYEIYVFIENLCTLDYLNFGGRFPKLMNDELEKQNSGYRIVKGKVLKITSDEEITSIENAINSDKSTIISTHLKSALQLLSNKEKPDYRNSMKESITAVEAICSFITGKPKATLGEALKILETKHKLHPAFKKSLTSLYGYTSDAGGMRHSLIKDDIVVDYDDAMFMLVSCSAFTNYLRSKS